MPDKVAFFMPALNTGGAERSTTRLANALAARGYPVDMVLSRATGAILAEVSSAVRIVPLSGALTPSSGKATLLSIPALSRYLHRERPGVLISAMETPNVAAWIARAVSRSSVQLVATVRNHLATEGGSLPRRLFLRHVAIACYRSKAVNVVAVSNGVADAVSILTGRPRHEVRTIYNPVVGDDIFALAQTPLPIEIAPDARLIVAAGRLVPEKDFATLILSFARLRREKESVKLIILGEGQEREHLRDLTRSLGVESDVFLPGMTSNPFPYMRRADVFVSSSTSEGFGSALTEAIALGAQIVAADCPTGPREILEDGRWGRLVPVGNESAMASAIHDALNFGGPDPTPRARDFTVDAAVARYIDLIEGWKSG